MANRLLCRLLLGALAIAGAPFFTPPSEACPFCGASGTTLTDDVNQASMVLYGALKNPRLDAGNEFSGGATDLDVLAVVKKHEILGDKKSIVLPRYIPVDKDSKVKFLIFCDVFKGKLDPYKGVPVKSDDIVKYLSGAVTLKDKDIPTRLKFFFGWLDNADVEISNDAYKEFGNADYKDFRPMAKDLPADKVVKWLKDPNTPGFRFGLYASMLGHAGKPEHAVVLRQLLDDPQKRLSSGVDGMLAGYTMLNPQEGWAYTRNIMADPHGRLLGGGFGLIGGGAGTAYLKDQSRDFMLRYAALRSARFFWEYRPDLVSNKQVLETVSLLLDQSDIADLAVEDLRKWKAKEPLDKVLGLMDRPSHSIPIIRRAVLRYAMTFPDNPKATAFVAALRKKDPEWVKDVEELMKIESGSK